MTQACMSRIARRGKALVSLGALAFGALAFAACGGGAARAPAAKAAPPAAAPPPPVGELQPSQDEVRDQHTAQVAWCDYLQELYKRAAKGATTWPRYQQCADATTYASPKMLKQTAECSRAALQRFQGDPFTPEYAAEVSRCGAEALDRMEVTQNELAPFVSTICGRMTTCGQVEYGECRDNLQAGLGTHFERAIGAMNTKGRSQLRSCLKTVTCQDMASQITTCLEPLMEGLLWLPG